MMYLHCIAENTLKMTYFLILDFEILVMDTVLSHKEIQEKEDM